jgi:hypothetical protein
MTEGGGGAYSRRNRGRTVVGEPGVTNQEALEVPWLAYYLPGHGAAVEKVCRICRGCSDRGSGVARYT